MRVMVIVKGDKNSEASILPKKELFAEMGKFNEQLAKAGLMLAGEGLQPSSKGKRVKVSGTTRTVIDGPFTESKELIAGFWLGRVRSMEEAVEWLKRAPFDGGTGNESRQELERRSNGKLAVTDGPFTEAKELVGGFAILKANSKEEAIELTRQFLRVAGDGECELRQLYEMNSEQPDQASCHQPDMVAATR